MLLYLGQGLYGTLHRRPFTIERPIQFSVTDIQRMRPLFRDVNMKEMYFERRDDSDFEKLVTSDEICELEEPKPELLPDRPTPSVLDVDYIPDYIPIKLETDESTQLIGHLIQQPAPIAKSIKQEIIDNAAHNIVECHSTSCALKQYVQQKDISTGLKLSDVRSLADADTQSYGPPVIKLEPQWDPTADWDPTPAQAVEAVESGKATSNTDATQRPTEDVLQKHLHPKT